MECVNSSLATVNITTLFAELACEMHKWVTHAPKFVYKTTIHRFISQNSILTAHLQSASFTTMATTECGSTVKAVLLPALKKLIRGLTVMVEDGRENFRTMRSERLEEYVNADCKVGLLAIQPIDEYIDCLEETGVKTREELEELWKGCYHDEEVRECVEEILSLEESFQELYDEIDGEIQKAEDGLAVQVTRVHDLLPADLSLIECKSGKAVHLKSIWKKSKFTLFVPLKFYF